MKIADIEVTAIHPERWGDDLDVVNGTSLPPIVSYLPVVGSFFELGSLPPLA